MNCFNFVAIDFETATEDRSSICEVGITVVVNSKITESRSWLVKPKGNQYNPFNTYIHGITKDMTKNAPRFPEVWAEIEPYLSNNIVIAHNTAFDMYALRSAMESHNIPFPTFTHYCSYRIAKHVIGGCSRYSLPIVCDAIGIPMNEHHRAEGDSMACANVFLKCLEVSGVAHPSELQEKYEFKCGSFAPGVFTPQLSTKKYNGCSTKASSIVGDSSKIDKGSCFYEKHVCFTGSFEFGKRTELQQRIADIGGVPVDGVTRKTDILVVGQQDFKKVGESGISSKQQKAMALLTDGHDIEIMSETDFLCNI